MALIVVDASVVVKALFPSREGEAGIDRAVALWERVHAGRDEMVQPPHWLAEVGAILARLSPATAELDMEDLHAMEVPVLGTGAVYRGAVSLAVEMDHHLFDTLYHAVALDLPEATLVTADER
ncbi:MAG TPA: type II toxin-antitoxin system VapC family toxin, partial [Longimicrobiaceae bacterium]|nr:type II toxin-antitoxin system VapC family toxin [Longimicrobiaceae bacterium]